MAIKGLDNQRYLQVQKAATATTTARVEEHLLAYLYHHCDTWDMYDSVTVTVGVRKFHQHLITVQIVK